MDETTVLVLFACVVVAIGLAVKFVKAVASGDKKKPPQPDAMANYRRTAGKDVYGRYDDESESKDRYIRRH